jgi:hypothetical protein
VQERPDDLLLHAFFLVTNLNKFDWPPEKILALYRKRGSAEAHMGEVKSALDVHLSSTDRGTSTIQDVMARNEVSLLLNLYAYTPTRFCMVCGACWSDRPGKAGV